LVDQLTLSQPRGADYAHHIILAPPNFQTLRRPWQLRTKSGFLVDLRLTAVLSRQCIQLLCSIYYRLTKVQV
jgi:hypothetical protein